MGEITTHQFKLSQITTYNDNAPLTGPQEGGVGFGCWVDWITLSQPQLNFNVSWE